MLTKQAREKIAERAKICDCLHFSGLYECLLGHSVPADTSNKEDYKVFLARLIDLCDTSDMVELPRDKDGKVIHIGDTVYFEDDRYKVRGYEIRESYVGSILVNDEKNECISTRASLVTHKEPVAIALLAKRIKDVLDDENTYIAKFAYVELNHIADIMENLGDGNE